MQATSQMQGFEKGARTAVHCFAFRPCAAQAPEAVMESDALPVLLMVGAGILATAGLSKHWQPGPIPEIIYTPVWGRAEPVRLALAAAGLEWKEVHYGTTDAMKAKAGTADFPFGQIPIFVDDSLRVAQMDSFMRHIGRKHGMYGRGLEEAAMIDMVMLGVEDLRKQYLKVIYENADAAAYVRNHIDPASRKGRNGGAHFSFLVGILERNGGGGGYVVGSKLSIADISLYNMCKLVLRKEFGHEEDFKSLQPLLVNYIERIESEPRIAEYIARRQCSKANGNEKG
jgi:glutathione S-transferase